MTIKTTFINEALNMLPLTLNTIKNCNDRILKSSLIALTLREIEYQTRPLIDMNETQLGRVDLNINELLESKIYF